MNKWLIGLVVLVAGVGVGWYVMQGQNQQETTEKESVTQEMPATSPTPGASVEEMVVTTPGTTTGELNEKGGVTQRTVVTYSDTGFAPKTVTVKKGATVTFMNESGKGMWVASALHPTHQLLPGFDQLKSAARGGSYEYTFKKVGTWKYHNHVAASDFGSVTVTE